MDVWVLNNDFQNDILVQDFESLIVTFRFNEYGDFKLIVKNTFELINLFKSHKWIGFGRLTDSPSEIYQTDRVMMIEDLSMSGSGTDKDLLVITGRSIEAFLENRYNPAFNADYNLASANFTAYMVRLYAGNEANIVLDRIPQLFVAGSWELGPVLSYTQLKAQPLYASISEVSKIEKIGFWIARNFGSPQPLNFRSYYGVDRSEVQSVNPVVRFNVFEGSLDDTRYLWSIRNEKSVCQVEHDGGLLEVNSGGFTPTSWYRKIIRVQAMGLGVGTGGAPEVARKTLSEHRISSILDGNVSGKDVPIFEKSDYGGDYLLGDLVSLTDAYGNTRLTAQVTEYTYSIDINGIKGFPTFEAV